MEKNDSNNCQVRHNKLHQLLYIFSGVYFFNSDNLSIYIGNLFFDHLLVHLLLVICVLTMVSTYSSIFFKVLISDKNNMLKFKIYKKFTSFISFSEKFFDRFPLTVLERQVLLLFKYHLILS